MGINEKISNYIRLNRISQVELAKKIGVGQQNLNRLLRASDIKSSTLIKISEALGLSPTYFIENKAKDCYQKNLEMLEVLYDGELRFVLRRVIVNEMINNELLTIFLEAYIEAMRKKESKK